MARVSRIVRVKPRRGIAEEPVMERGCYVLANPKHGAEKHHAINKVYAKSLEDAAALIEAGYSIRMGGPGKVPSLICPRSLRIIWR